MYFFLSLTVFISINIVALHIIEFNQQLANTLIKPKLFTVGNT